MYVYGVCDHHDRRDLVCVCVCADRRGRCDLALRLSGFGIYDLAFAIVWIWICHLRSDVCDPRDLMFAIVAQASGRLPLIRTALIGGPGS